MGENEIFRRFVVFFAKLRNFTDRQFHSVSIGSVSVTNIRMRNEAGTGSESERSESEKAMMVEEHKPVSYNASEAEKVNVGVEKKALDGISLLAPISPQSGFHSIKGTDRRCRQSGVASSVIAPKAKFPDALK